MFIKQLCLVLSLNSYAYQAVVIVPVADMVGQFAEDGSSDNAAYEALPYYSRVGVRHACPRVYQALFNETVEVIEERGLECKVQYSGALYMSSGLPCNTFCMLKECLLPLADVDASTLPCMPDFQVGLDSFSSDDIVLTDCCTVQLPSGKVTFSAGTRFKKLVGTHDKVYYLNDIVEIPQDVCLVNNTNTSYEEKVLLFLKHLKRWAHNPSGFIPYLWGGGSVAYYVEHGVPFEQVDEGTQTTWGYADYDFATKSGVDCSSLIVRAAQIVGLPFFYRNTYTIEQHLRDISAYNYGIENGDIIWFKGHVIVVSDIDKNLCIESRGYPAGFGRVQEIELSDLFQGIKTFDDLKEALMHKMPLSLLDKQGETMLTIDEFKILKLASAK